MEAACQQAALCNIYTYQYFDRLLKQTPPPDTLPIAHPNLRGKAYYAPSPEDLAKEALHAIPFHANPPGLFLPESFTIPQVQKVGEN
jgi:hypothetical protein